MPTKCSTWVVVHEDTIVCTEALRSTPAHNASA